MTSKKFLVNNLAWGFVDWLFGYILGIVFIAFIPENMVGWVIMPFGILFTIWILNKKIELEKISEYFILGIIWMSIAIVLDYFLIVKLFSPTDGYYKLDVYLYYLIVLFIPSIYNYFRSK